MAVALIGGSLFFLAWSVFGPQPDRTPPRMQALDAGVAPRNDAPKPTPKPVVLVPPPKADEPRTPAPPPPPIPVVADEVQLRLLGRINHHRRAIGLLPVVLGSAAVDGAVRHAKYIEYNIDDASVGGLQIHDEDPNRRGYSAEGRRAAGRAVIAIQRGGGPDVVDQWMATLYHRLPLIHPGLSSVGIGVAGVGYTRIFVVVCSPPGRVDAVVVVPKSGDTKVPASFALHEVPNPIPLDLDGEAGFPLTMTFPAGQKISDVQVGLKDTIGRDVPHWLSTPDAPAVENRATQTIAAIAKDPFDSGARYVWTVRARVNGAPFDRTVHFVTR